MADIRAALRTFILTDATVTGLISTRLYWCNAPQEVIKPYAVYWTVTDPDDRIEVGKDASEPVIEFDSIASNAADAINLDTAIRAKVLEYTGTISGINIRRITPTNMRDLTNLEDDFIIQREFRVEYDR